jgi:hypothetical protein
VFKHLISPYQRLLLCATWAAGDQERLVQYEELQVDWQFTLQKLSYAHLCSLKQQQEVLGLPELGTALFQECMRRMEAARTEAGSLAARTYNGSMFQEFAGRMYN